jgi:3-hydroxyisobutyrate dehydrogenase-like beta-hydroxyacid dehydrogenase
MAVGFIGLGMMGKSMAANMLKGGNDVIVHDMRREAAAPHLEQGAKWADSVGELAAAVDVVFTSLPGPPEVEAVALGDGGLLANLKPGSTLFDLSTNAPSMVRKIHARFLEKDLHMMDAPVSGGPRGALTGKLAILVGGDESVFQKHKPLLDAMGDQPRYIGPIGAGSIAKLAHNCAGYVIQTALAEVFTMGVKGGVEPIALWEAMRSGAVGRRRTFDGMIDQFLSGKYDPAAFALRLAHKDVSLTTQLGRELGLPMRLANQTLEEMTEARARGWDERDSRVTMMLQVERAGVDVTVTPEQLELALTNDPPASGNPKRS